MGFSKAAALQADLSCIKKYSKIGTKVFGPYKVIAMIGKVAYKLELPPISRIH